MHNIHSTSHQAAAAVQHARRIFLIFCLPFSIQWRWLMAGGPRCNFRFSYVSLIWDMMHHQHYLFPIWDHISEQLKWWITTAVPISREERGTRGRGGAERGKTTNRRTKIYEPSSVRHTGEPIIARTQSWDTSSSRHGMRHIWSHIKPLSLKMGTYICLECVFLHAIMQRKKTKNKMENKYISRVYGMNKIESRRAFDMRVSAAYGV